MVSPLKTPNREKSGGMTSSCIDALLKIFIRNHIGKTHKTKRG
jgi:hypothetical protein